MNIFLQCGRWEVVMMRESQIKERTEGEAAEAETLRGGRMDGGC